MNRILLLLAVALSSGDALADRFVLAATNPGPIQGTGRSLQFDLSGVSGEIRTARLELDLNYANAADLGVRLVDASGFVVLPIAPQGEAALEGKVLAGSYRFTDDAVTTWVLAAGIGSTIQASFPVRAYQPGLGGPCTNLLARFLEFDIGRETPLTLAIDRRAGATGTGTITAARLVLDTGLADEIMASGFDEPDAPMGRCRPPSLNVLLNGQEESPTGSTLTIVNTTGSSQPMAWYVRDFVNADVGPILFGQGGDAVYAGRFGGRNRFNIGFWNAATGTVNFTTGAGARTISLPPPAGGWPALLHQVMPGDYDGDGTTDAAVAFLDPGLDRWALRLRFSRSGNIRDYLIDPRSFAPAVFQSSQIGLGAGQDADRNGVDELLMYAVSVGGVMRAVQLTFNGESLDTAFTNAWGQPGDRMVLGKWVGDTSGNQFGLMVYRPAPAMGVGTWFLFPSVAGATWGGPGDMPMSLSFDGDALNDLAVYRPADRRVYVIGSVDGTQFILDPLGGETGFNTPLGTLQGTIAPLPQ